jgi:cytoskeleton protein RodZ
MTDVNENSDPAFVGGGPGPGVLLRAARLERGLDVAAVVAALRVDARVIEALEEDRFTVFDAPVYARGFLRTYANFLGLSPERVLSAYDVLAVAPVTPTLVPLATARMPTDYWRKLRVPVLGLVGFLVVLAAVVWLVSHFWGGGAPAAETAAVRVDAPVVETRKAPQMGQTVAVDAGAVGTADKAVGRGAKDAPTSPAVDPAAPEPLIVTATGGDSWVEVSSPKNGRLLYETLHQGEMRAIKGPGPWRVFLGEPSALYLTVGERTVVVPPARRGPSGARFVINGDGAAN